MAGESYTSPVTGETYTVPKYTDPADAPIAFKDFADTITGGGGIDIPATRVDAVVQTLNGTSWVEGMALSVSDTVPADTEGQVGDVVFISGLPDGLPVGGGKVIEANSSNAALRVTQTGTGDVLLLEDSAHPDTTPFVVNSSGNVGIGTNNPAWVLDIVHPQPRIGLTDTDTGVNHRIDANSTSGDFAILVDYNSEAADPDFNLSIKNKERFKVNSAGLITGTGPSLGAWTAYTPTLGGTGWAIGNGTASGAYCQIGKTVHFWARLVFGSTTVAGTGSGVLGAPITYIVTYGATYLPGPLQSVLFDSSSGANYFLMPRASSKVGFSFRYLATADGKVANVVEGSPIAFDSGDVIVVSGTYEAA